MQLTDHILTIGTYSESVPKLSVDATVHAWSVPTAYRSSGYFVSVQRDGEPVEEPACDGRDAVYLGSVELAADEEAKAEAELGKIKDDACARIEVARKSLEQSGVTISWPDGATSKIQTRDERDWRNINGVAARGLARLMQGLSDEDWFRDADDVNHALLPTQAVDMGYQAASAISAIAKVAQDAKDSINANTVTTAAQIAEIEAGVVWPSS